MSYASLWCLRAKDSKRTTGVWFAFKFWCVTLWGQRCVGTRMAFWEKGEPVLSQSVVKGCSSLLHLHYWLMVICQVHLLLLVHFQYVLTALFHKKFIYVDENKPTVISVGVEPRMLLTQSGNQSSWLTDDESRMWFPQIVISSVKKIITTYVANQASHHWWMVFLPWGAQNSHTWLWLAVGHRGIHRVWNVATWEVCWSSLSRWLWITWQRAPKQRYRHSLKALVHIILNL